MTMNGYLKCEVCGKITQVKIGVSHNSTQFPIYIPCKNCDTLFVGRYSQDDTNVEIHTDFINAEEISAPDNLPDYICTITQDFISQKVRDVVSAEDTITLPEWMMFSERLGEENKEKVFLNINELNSSGKQAVFEWERVLNLWFNKKNDLLKKQLEYFLDASSNNIKLDNEKNYLSAMRKLTTGLTRSLFSINEYDIWIANLKADLGNVSKTNESNLKAFIRKLGEMDLFIPLEKDISARIVQLFQYISDLTPIYTLRELSETERKQLFNVDSEYGVFTTSFDRIKPLYIDLFETIIKTLVVPIGLNNVLIRGSHNNFNSSNIRNIDSFLNLPTAYEKMKYIEASNTFGFNIKSILNNKLRNSIGHCSYEISNIDQIIKYDRGNKKVSLSQILFESYQMMIYLIKTFHIVTLLHEAYYEFYV